MIDWLLDPEHSDPSIRWQVMRDLLDAAQPEWAAERAKVETEGTWPRTVVDMLLAAWGATIGTPAFISSTVFDILALAPRSFRQWVADHATAFMDGPASNEA